MENSPFRGNAPQGAIRRIFKWLLLGYIRLGDCPTGLEPPAGARNRKKATVKNTTNRPLRGVAT